MAHLNPCVKSIIRGREISSEKRKTKLVENQFGGEGGEMKRRKKKSVRGKPKGKKKTFDFRCSDCQKSISRELKLFHSTRATSRCKKKKKQEVRHYTPRGRGYLLH